MTAPKTSAGLLMFRRRGSGVEVFLAHPGGPYFTHKDDGFWGIPKGEIHEGEAPLDTACREFEEETGLKPHGPFQPIGSIRQKSGKLVHAWAFESDWDGSTPLSSNHFEMEWPPHSGRRQSFPEVDQAGFFSLEEARRKLNEPQREFLQRVLSLLQEGSPS